MLRLVSLLGIVVMLAICYVLSKHRRAVSWRVVGVGLLLQAVLGLTFLFWADGNAALQAVGRGFSQFLDLGAKGSQFVFGNLAKGDGGFGFLFAFQILPTLIFFSSFMAVLYYLGIMQLVVRAMAWVMVRVLGTSGSESLSACANVFVGQTEAPLLVRPFLKGMTMSELHTVMVGGFCTIAGGVFALYVQFIGGDDPVARGQIAGHLMVASVMAVPAGLVCSKLLWPETEQSETLGTVAMIESADHGNVVEAAAAGASDGLKLALNVGAMLIAFLALIAVVDSALSFLPGEPTLQSLLGLVFWPIAAVMGVPADEVSKLAELIGTKLVATELVAYGELGQMVAAGQVSPRTQLMASFALCGFASFGSVAIQIGGLGALAPERRGDLARLGIRAMFAGALATCMTACVAGILMGDAGGDAAGLDQSVAENTVVTLGIAATGELESRPRTYSWTQTGGVAVTLSDGNARQPTFTAPDAAGNCTLTFQVACSDGTTTTTDSVTINVSPPKANAGPDQRVLENAVVTLDATGSTETGSQALTYTWAQTGGPSVTLSDGSAAQPTFKAPDAAGNYALTFQVAVSDGSTTTTDSITVTVTVDE